MSRPSPSAFAVFGAAIALRVSVRRPGNAVHSWTLADAALPLLFSASRLLRAIIQPRSSCLEIDANLKLNSSVRFVFQAKETREGGDPTQAEVGPSVEFYLKPLLKLKRITHFDLDDAKSRPLVLAVGYRVVPSPGKPTINRMEPVAHISRSHHGSHTDFR